MYFIRKASRGTATHPYTGITCEQAGIEPGKWYATREEAEADAAKLAEHNAVGFKVEFKFNGSLPNLFNGFTVDQWFTHHPPRTEARKVEHGKVDRAIRALAEELLLREHALKEVAAQECTAEIRTIQALPITIEWAAEYIDGAREEIYNDDSRERVKETIRLLSQARQTLHQGIALLELQQLGEANPEEVQLREEIRDRGKEEEAPMPDAVRLELERARDEVREARREVLETKERIAELEARKQPEKVMTDRFNLVTDLQNQIDTALARIAELEERLKEPDEDAEAYTKELEDRLERLGEDFIRDIANLEKQIGFLSSALATTKHTPSEWRLIAAKVVELTQEAE
jgi:hypothetical protein